MSDPTPPSGHFAGFMRRGLARSRPAHWVALGAVGVAVLGLAGLRSVELPGPRGVADSDRLRIEVVAPVEPDVAPGSIMDVGELVDGFRYTGPERVQRADATDPAWSGDEEPAPYEPPLGRAEVRRYSTASDAYEPPAEPERPRRERERRWFGFDNPLPDFGAERRARQARLDALEEQRRAERDDRAERRRYESEPLRYEDRRDDRRYDNPPREDRREQPADGPYGPEVG